MVGISTTADTNINNDYLYYEPWLVPEEITVDALVCEVTTLGASGVVLRMGIYAADTDWQPSGAPLADAGTVAVGAGDGTGVKTKVLGSPVTLSAGRYVAAWITNGLPVLRAVRGGLFSVNPSLGANTFYGWWRKSGQTGVAAGGLANPGTKWDAGDVQNVPFVFHVFARLSAV